MANKTDFSGANIEIKNSKDVSMGNIETKAQESKKTDLNLEAVTGKYFTSSLTVKILILVTILAVFATAVVLKT